MLLKLKWLWAGILSVLYVSVYAQKDELRHTYYFDSLDHWTTKDSAVYKNLQYKTKDGWRIEYWQRKEQPTYLLSRKEIKSDTTEKPEWIKIIRYYNSGVPSEYRMLKSGVPQSTIHYAKSGVKNAEVNYTNGKITREEGWDSLGHSIHNFIYEREAEFAGGASKWKQYLIKTLKTSTPADRRAPNGNYTVVVSFYIDTLGNVKNVRADNNPGYGTAEEAVRVVANSPKWTPAIFMSKKSVYRQRQQITFQVTGGSTDKDTVEVYVDKNQKTVSKSNAFMKVVNIKANDSTRMVTFYMMSPYKRVQEARVITSSSGVTYSLVKTFDINGNLLMETEIEGKQPKRIVKYYADGKKASEVLYGDVGLPIKESRWDEDGNFIDPTKN